MPIASRTFVNFEVMKNADFDMQIDFSVEYDTDTKDYSLAIAADYDSSIITTLKSDHSGAGVARIIKTKAAEDSGDKSYITVYIPATGATTVNTFGTDDFDDGFEGTWELLETDNSTPSVTIRQAEGDIIVRSAVTPYLAYSAPA